MTNVLQSTRRCIPDGPGHTLNQLKMVRPVSLWVRRGPSNSSSPKAMVIGRSATGRQVIPSTAPHLVHGRRDVRDHDPSVEEPGRHDARCLRIMCHRAIHLLPCLACPRATGRPLTLRSRGRSFDFDMDQSGRSFSRTIAPPAGIRGLGGPGGTGRFLRKAALRSDSCNCLRSGASRAQPTPGRHCPRYQCDPMAAGTTSSDSRACEASPIEAASYPRRSSPWGNAVASDAPMSGEVASERSLRDRTASRERESSAAPWMRRP